MSRARDRASSSPTISGDLTVSGDLVPSTPLSHRNMIINGGMNVAQRSTSSTSSGYNTVDRFYYEWATVGATQSQLAITSGDPFDVGFRYVYRLTNTSVTTTTSAYTKLVQNIEAQNIAGSGWNYTSTSSYVTLSFWARSSLAGTYYSQLRTVDGTEYLYSKAFVLAANTWLKVTMTVPGNSNLTINNDNGKGMEVDIYPHVGTDNSGGGEVTTESWYTRGGQADAYLPNFAQAWMNTASATFDVTGVQLELGSNATPFEHRSYGDELQRCQRYFQRLGIGTNATALGMGMTSTTTTAQVAVPLATVMRASPTVTVSNMTVTDWQNYTSALSDPANTYATASHVSLNFNRDQSPAWGEFRPCLYTIGGSGTGYTNFTAEL